MIVIAIDICVDCMIILAIWKVYLLFAVLQMTPITTQNYIRPQEINCQTKKCDAIRDPSYKQNGRERRFVHTWKTQTKKVNEMVTVSVCINKKIKLREKKSRRRRKKTSIAIIHTLAHTIWCMVDMLIWSACDTQFRFVWEKHWNLHRNNK